MGNEAPSTLDTVEIKCELPDACTTGCGENVERSGQVLVQGSWQETNYKRRDGTTGNAIFRFSFDTGQEGGPALLGGLLMAFGIKPGSEGAGQANFEYVKYHRYEAETDKDPNQTWEYQDGKPLNLDFSMGENSLVCTVDLAEGRLIMPKPTK